ncbi:MAG: polysaccharide deacetylase family protein [bacterium]
MNALTIDAEDWYHDETRGSGPASPEEIAGHGSRIDRNLRKILEILDEQDAHATLFCVAELAESHAPLLREAVAQGHEIASHGLRHLPVSGRDRTAVREDFRRSKKMLEDAIGIPVEGFRAPLFLRRQDDLWALDLLAQEGFRWDSSWMPLRYHPSAPDYITPGGRPGRLANGLWEFPLPLSRMPTGHTLPVAAGGFTLRALPFAFTRHYLTKYNREHGAAILYTHPWELDTESPKLPGTPAYVRFWNGIGRSGMPQRLRQLTREFRFAPIRQTFATELNS